MKHFISQLSLRNKILLPIILLTIVSSLIVSWSSYSQASKALRANMLQEMTQIVDMTARQLDGWVQDGTAGLEGYAEQKVFKMAMDDGFLGKSAKVSANVELERLAKRYPYYEAMALVGTNGLVVASSQTNYLNLSVGDQIYFGEVMSGKTVVSDVTKSSFTTNSVMVFACPIKEKEAVIGAIISVVDLARFSKETIDPIRVLETGYLYLVNKTGLIVMHKNHSLIKNLDISKDDWGRKMLQAKSGNEEYEFQGVLKMAVFAPLKSLGFTLAATVPIAELEGPARKIGYTSILFGVMTIVLSSIVVLLLARSIVNPVNALIQNLMVTADQLGDTAGQISNASQSLAEGASEQAASLEETSASLEEMASMTRRNAENAKGAKDSANQSRKAAEEGSRTTHQMSGAMEKIQSSGQAMRGAMDDVKSANNEVSKIIKTIDEIAFQTNILALNAAVEAARAGEAGLGFAVVAGEVRNLAQKSAESARDTANRIQAAIERSERGTKLSEQMADDLLSLTSQAKQMEEGLNGIVGKTQQVDQMVAEIASASIEQNQGIEQVNRAVSEMDKVTQSNAANAEESSSASCELKRQAEALRDAIGDLTALVRGATNAKPELKTMFVAPASSPDRGIVKQRAIHQNPRAGNGVLHDSHPWHS